ncbi:fungal-specific transcription factor domain-containing protein [Mycena metata]|uniref:Fungal-specific transcription factor domain-containing protein n=1 Tax=Mycena metata TaxID=1033252 RepID=A0AAD7NLC5_9AGAR|nr:fungal-specific transcription factor domain-containing protein [Mycena metata]
MQESAKKTRLRGPCNRCKAKKIRCNSAQMAGNRCTNCLVAKIQCKHTTDSSEGEDSDSEASFSESIKAGQEHVAAVLSTSTIYIPSNDPEVSHQQLVEVCLYARSLEDKLAGVQLQTSRTITESESPLSADSGTLLNTPEESGAGGNGWEPFYGPSSSVKLVHSTMEHIEWSVAYEAVVMQHNCKIVRPPWEKLTFNLPPQVFPEPDLLKSLVAIYFGRINPILDILHFPTFRQSLADDLHLRDHMFGAIVLVVCAVASRYSDDARVFLDDDSEHGCGWKWFRQVNTWSFHLTGSPEPSLHLLQLVILSVTYLAGMATVEEQWTLTGVGIRLAQSAGAHDRNAYRGMDPLTGELYKRAFWVLVGWDAMLGALTGRPSMTRRAEIDLDLPLTCDQEYWESPSSVPSTPKPFIHAYLNIYVQLMLIFTRIQSNSSVEGHACSEDVVAELDSALNKWVDTIPEHLKWDPLQENQVFLDQSAALYAVYYHAQILIHRPFIRAPGDEAASKTRFPSLAVCANAARACGHVLDVQARRGRGLVHVALVMVALFDSAFVLLVNVWDIAGRNFRSPKDLARATADAQRCVRILQLYARRWPIMAKKCGVITAMLDFAKQSSEVSLKRQRAGSEIPEAPHLRAPPRALTDPSPLTDPSIFTDPPPLADASITQQMRELEDSLTATNHLFSLPLYTEELGRLPVYDAFDYQFAAQPDIGAIHTEPEPDSSISSLVPELEGLDTSGRKYPWLPPTSSDGLDWTMYQGIF